MEAVTNTRDYTPLAAQGVDTVLEVTLTQLVAERYPEMADPPLPLDMQARARLVRTRDNTEISSNEYFYAARRTTITSGMRITGSACSSR